MSNRKRASGLIVLSLVVAVVMAIVALDSRGQNSSTAQDKPTPIQRGKLTQRQREHGKLFKNKGVGNIYALIQRRSAEGDSEAINIESLPGTPELSRSGEVDSDRLVTSVAQADAVVIGVVTDKTSQLNEAETFIFTDYAVNVVEVLKNNAASPISPNAVITVTRTGGVVQLEGHIVRAVDRTAKPLQVGDKYLLFLRHLPATGAYLASEGPNSFKLEGDTVMTLTEDPRYVGFQRGKDVVSFVNAVRSAIGTNNEGKR
jgi:hypothetical protein